MENRVRVPWDAGMSVYLDLVRLGAAMLVFMYHVGGQRLTGGLFWRLGPYGSQAVTVFFVLSGAVIAMAAEGRCGRDFAAARVSRIASVAVPALVATLVLDAVGQWLQPALYAASWGFGGDAWWVKAATGLLFVHELWFGKVVIGSNLPYWSLGFEVWYYLVFGLAVFGGRWRWVWAAVALVVAGPKIGLLFPVWLFGCGAWWVARRGLVGRSVGLGLWAGSIAAWVGYEAAVQRFGRPFGVMPDALMRPEVVEDYVVGLLMAVNLVGASAASAGFGRLSGCVAGWIGRPVRWAAGASFTLYLFHLPLAQMLAAACPWGVGTWPGRMLVVGGTLGLVLCIAQRTERRRGDWRLIVDRLLGAWWPGVMASGRVADRRRGGTAGP